MDLLYPYEYVANNSATIFRITVITSGITSGIRANTSRKYAEPSVIWNLALHGTKCYTNVIGITS